LIPQVPRSEWLLTKRAFSRDRKLSFSHLVAFLLAQVGSTDTHGSAIMFERFIRNASRSGLWPDAAPIDKSSLCRARSKLCWSSFRDLLGEAVAMAYELWDNKPQHSWHGMSVFAIDGSQYQLPASDEIREEFESPSTLSAQSKSHYPHALVSTAFDVFRRFPVARIVDKSHGSEREHALALLDAIPKGGVVMMDRGYPSFEMLKNVAHKYAEGFFVMRSSGSQIFKAVEQFLKGRQQEARVSIPPSKKFHSRNPGQNHPAMMLQIIRLQSPDGTVSAILTNLPCSQHSAQDIINLYYRRWEVENYYRDEKDSMCIQTIHSKSANGVRQELFCSTIVSVVARIMVMLCSMQEMPERAEPQFKNALSDDIAILVTNQPYQC
jgi:hypothetical protein